MKEIAVYFYCGIHLIGACYRYLLIFP